MRVLRTCVASCALLVACAEAAPPPLLITEDTVDGVTTLRLSRSIEAIAADRELVTTLRPDLDVGRDSVWFGRIADVEGLGGGAFAVLDRMQHQIVVVDSSGSVRRRIGREGEGPGELEDPWALTKVGDNLIVWQPQRGRVFTVYGTDGALRAVGSVQVEGDWIRSFFRYPLTDLEGGQRSPEDVTRRLQPFGDDAFIHILQTDEFAAGERSGHRTLLAPPTHVIRYDLDALVRDTVATLAGTDTYLMDPMAGMPATYEQPIFTARPLFAAGVTWYATGHGDSAHIDVRTMDGEQLLRLEWPAARREVADEDRLESARWILAMRVLNSEASRRTILSDSRRGRARGLRATAFEHNSFADSIPHVADLSASGSCLFVAGHSAADHGDGSSLTWAVFNIDHLTLEAVIRLEPVEIKPELIMGRTGQAVRDINQGFAFTSYRDGDGVWHARRYVIPSPIQCD